MAEWISGLGQSKSPAASEFAAQRTCACAAVKWPHAEHAVFDGPDAVDGDRLGEVALDRRLRVEAVDDFPGEGLVGVHVFGGEHDDTRSETVAKSVHAGTGFAFLGTTGGGGSA
jgi:hypothetical protein